MDNTRKIGYAVTGLGVGNAHARAAFNSKNGKLIAVCDLIEEKLEKAKKDYGDILTYTDFDEMLKNPDIEVVAVRANVEVKKMISRARGHEGNEK